MLLRVNEQWRSIYFLGDHFNAVASGRKLCVLILVYLGSAFVGLCRFSRCVVDNFYFWYCVEGMIFCHEGTDTLAEFTDRDVDIPKEGAACPLPCSCSEYMKSGLVFSSIETILER